MLKTLLDNTFAKAKIAAGLDYAVTDTDSFGDCNTCVNQALADEFGENSTGIYAKYWESGMNAGKHISVLDSLYIAHDITPQQADILIGVLSKYYTVTPAAYDPTKTFCISERRWP